MTSRSAIRKDFAERFGKQLEEHLKFGQRLVQKAASSAEASRLPSKSPEKLFTEERLESAIDSGRSTFTARIRDYIDQHGVSKHDYEDTGAENHGDLQEIMDRALSSGSVRLRQRDDENNENTENSRRSFRNDNDRSRTSIGARSQQYKQERSVSRTSHKSVGDPRDPREMRRSLQNSAKSIKSSSYVARTSPLKKFCVASVSGRSSVDSRESLKFMNRSPQSGNKKLTQSVDGRKERLELLNNSQSSQGKSSERFGVGAYKRPQTTRTEITSFFSQSPSASIDYSIRSTNSAKKGKGSKGKPKEITALLFPSLGKKLTFKKKLIHDSMHRLQGSDQMTMGATTVGATRANSMKSGINGEHEMALKQVLANTSLTFESGEFGKSSEDSFQLRDQRLTSKSSRKEFITAGFGSEKGVATAVIEPEHDDENEPQEDQEEIILVQDDEEIVVEEKFSPKKQVAVDTRAAEKSEENGQGGVIQLRELFKHNFTEGGPVVSDSSISKQAAKRGSYPTIAGGSQRDSFNASQIFRHSEGESHVMNVSRLGEEFDANERLEEMRRYSMEVNLFGWSGENNTNNNVTNQAPGNSGSAKKSVRSQGTPQRIAKEQEDEDDMKETRIMQSGSTKRSKQEVVLTLNSGKKSSDAEGYLSVKSVKSIKSNKSVGTPLFLSLTQQSQHSASKRENSQQSEDSSIERSTDEFRRKLQEKVSHDVSYSSSKSQPPKPKTPKTEVMKKTEIAQPSPNLAKKRNSSGDMTTMIMGVKKRNESLEKELSKKVFSKPPVPSHSPQTSQLLGAVQQAAKQVKNSVVLKKVQDSKSSGVRKETFGPTTEQSFVVQDEALRENAEKDLEETADKVHIKTFLALRSILKPHKAISLCCEGLLKLFAGFEDIPEDFLHQENIEWNQTKSAFNTPIKLVNLVSTYKDLVANNEISSEKLLILSKSLNKIDEHMNQNHHEAFYQLYDFLNAALIYAQVFVKNEPLESVEEPEARQPTPMQLMELPRSKTDVIKNAFARVNGPRVSLDSSPQRPMTGMKHGQNNHTILRGQKGFKGVSTPTKEDKWNNTEALRPKFNNNAGGNKSRSPMKVGVKSATKTPVPVAKKAVGQMVRNDAKRAISALRNKEASIKERLQREEEEIIRNRAVLNMDVQPSEAEILIDEIDVKGREAREYRHRVKRMLADHDRYVKRFMQQQDDLEVEMNREDALQEWRKMNELLRQQNLQEKEYMHKKNINYIEEKREEKALKQHHEKENRNDDILENLNEHYFQEYLVKTGHENKQHKLKEKAKDVRADRLVKRQKEVMESLAQKEQFSRERRDYFKAKKIEIEGQRKKWQDDYILLTKLIGDAQ